MSCYRQGCMARTDLEVTTKAGSERTSFGGIGHKSWSSRFSHVIQWDPIRDFSLADRRYIHTFKLLPAFTHVAYCFFTQMRFSTVKKTSTKTIEQLHQVTWAGRSGNHNEVNLPGCQLPYHQLQKFWMLRIFFPFCFQNTLMSNCLILWLTGGNKIPAFLMKVKILIAFLAL